MKKFNNCTGQTAQVQFCTELVMRINGDENCDGTLKKACEGELFDNVIMRKIARKTKKLSKLPNSPEKTAEIEEFQEQLATYCSG